MSEYATTGDGILTGLHLVAEMARQKKSIAELASVMTIYPQVLINVRDVDKDRVADDEVVQQAVRDIEIELGDSGRVLAAQVRHRATGACDGGGGRRRVGACLCRTPRGGGAGAPVALTSAQIQ